MKKHAFIQLLQFITRKNYTRGLAVIAAAALFAFQDPAAFAQPPASAPYPYPEAAVPAIPPAQLNGMVAPIALYPDPLLSQVLVASTFPGQISQAYDFVVRNPGLNGRALVDAAAAQPWDASVQALVAFPQVLEMLAENMNWTANLGQAFQSQQAAVMDAVQRMRQEAVQEGRLQSTPELTVATVNEGGQPYIEILPANPQVVYVPQYQPSAIWGPAAYPYPQVIYPSTGALVSTGLLSFGAGVAVGSFFPYGGWGWNAGWGRHEVTVNRNFIQNNHFNRAFEGGRHNQGRFGSEQGRFGNGRPGFQGRQPGNEGMRGRFGNEGRGAGAANRGALAPGANPGAPAGRLGQPGMTHQGMANRGALAPGANPGAPAGRLGQPGMTHQGMANRGALAPGANPGAPAGRLGQPGMTHQGMANRGALAPGANPGAPAGRFGQAGAAHTGAMNRGITPATPHMGGAQRMATPPRATPGMGGGARSMGGGHMGGGRMGGGRMGGGRMGGGRMGGGRMGGGRGGRGGRR